VSEYVRKQTHLDSLYEKGEKGEMFMTREKGEMFVTRLLADREAVVYIRNKLLDKAVEMGKKSRAWRGVEREREREREKEKEEATAAGGGRESFFLTASNAEIAAKEKGEGEEEDIWDVKKSIREDLLRNTGVPSKPVGVRGSGGAGGGRGNGKGNGNGKKSSNRPLQSHRKIKEEKNNKSAYKELMEKLISNSIPEMSLGGGASSGVGRHDFGDMAEGEYDERAYHNIYPPDGWAGGGVAKYVTKKKGREKTVREKQGAVEEMPEEGLMGSRVEVDKGGFNLAFIENFPVSR
jgi:hypothetical protein